MKDNDNTKESLSDYIRANLRMSVAAFCREQNLSPATMYCRWDTPKGRANIKNMVFRIYVNNYKD